MIGDISCEAPPTGPPRLTHGKTALDAIVDAKSIGLTVTTVEIQGWTWAVVNTAEKNLYLTELAGDVEVYGIGYTELYEEKQYLQYFKHWQALAIANNWYSCPRCSEPRPSALNVGRDPGALSRWDNSTYICSECGNEEAMLGLSGEDISPTGPNKWIEIPSNQSEI